MSWGIIVDSLGYGQRVHGVFRWAVGLIVLALASIAFAAPQRLESQGLVYFRESAPSWFDVAVKPGSPSRFKNFWHYVASDRQVRVSGSNVEDTIMVVRRINDAAGLADGARAEALFDPTYQRLTLHEMSIVRAGKKIDVFKASSVSLLRREQRLEQLSYDGKVTASIVFEGAQIGDDLLYHYTVEGLNPVFEGRYVDTDTTRFTFAAADFVRRRFIYPVERNLNFRAATHLSRTQRDLTAREREIEFVRKDVDRLDLQTNYSPASYYDNAIQVSEFGAWSEINTWGQKLFAYSKGSQPETLRLAQRLLRETEGMSPQERAKLVLEFVQRDIRYFGVFFGDSSHRPNPADSVLRKRFGDCKDKTALLIALFTEMGYEPYPILVSQYFRGYVENALPSPYAFDHAIVGLTIDGAQFWLDGTRLHGAGALPSRQSWSFGKGLALRAGTTALTSSPARPTDDLDIDAVDKFVVSDWKKPAILVSTVRYRGVMAEQLQVLLNSPQRGAMEQSAFEALDRIYSSATVTQPLLVTPDSTSGDLVFTKSWEIPALLSLMERPSSLAVEYLAWVPSMGLRLPSSHRGDFYLGQQRRFRHVVSFEFPESVFSEPIKNNSTTGDEFFSLKSSFSASAKTSATEIQLELLKESVPANRWNAFREKTVEAMRKTGGALRVGLIPSDKMAAFRSDVNKLVADVQSKKVLSVTGVQEQAHMDALLMEHALFGGRLNPKAEAAALKARGVAKDNLGAGSVAVEILQRAIELDPEKKDSRVTLAEAQFGIGLFEDASKTLSHESLISYESDLAFSYLRGRNRFYMGQYQDAYNDLVSNSKIRVGNEKAYPLLWAALAATRLGKSLEGALSELDAQSSGDSWPQRLLANYLGKLSDVELLRIARDTKSDGAKRHQLCEANYFLGMKELAKGNKANAQTFFEKSIDTEVTEFIEYRASGFELKKMK
jgi:lipoprotein NlpI